MSHLTITLIGKVNSGKSLLCNRLLTRDVAGVAPVSGWTKEISIYPLGDGVDLADTPGLEDPDEAVSRRTFDFLGRTDIFIHVVNADEGLTRSVAETHEILRATSRPVILVCNKADHLSDDERRAVASQLAERLPSERLVVTSAKHGDGIGELTLEMWRILESRGDDLRFHRLLSVRIPEIARRLALAEEEADSCIRWATGRAAAIAAVPLPLADVYPLVANQLYMAKQIGAVYGLSLGDSMVKGLVGAMGASFVGLLVASFFPGIKIAIAASITFGTGKAIKAWCASGGTLSISELKKEFTRAKKEEQTRR